MIVEENGLKLELNEENRTARVIGSADNECEQVIPKGIKHDSHDYKYIIFIL